MDYSLLANDLQVIGVITVPIYSPGKRQQLHTQLLEEMKAFPEYKAPAGFESTSDRYQLGAFGAFSNPSAFHNSTVRKIRKKVRKKFKKIFRHIFGGEGWKWELLADRLGYRIKGDTLGGESWHRDISKMPFPEDFVLGGWTNLSDHDQFFSCVPGTQQLPENFDTGFAVIPKSEHKQHKENSEKFRVPPGHYICFYSHMIHEVHPGKIKHNSLRLFSGFRFTKHDTQPLHRNLQQFLDQAPISLGSGETPRMYARNHLSFHKQLVITFSENFKPQCTEEATGKDGVTYTRVHVVMKSLKDYNLTLYPPYTISELKMHFPRKLQPIE